MNFYNEHLDEVLYAKHLNAYLHNHFSNVDIIIYINIDMDIYRNILKTASPTQCTESTIPSTQTKLSHLDLTY